MKPGFLLMFIVLGMFVYLNRDILLEQPEGDIQIELSADTTAVSDQVLHLTGAASNIPDGAFLVYQITAPDGDENLVEGLTTVRGERFDERIDVAHLDADTFDVRLVFQIIVYDRMQPAEVVDRFGSGGERIGGEQVQPGELGNRAEVVVRAR